MTGGSRIVVEGSRRGPVPGHRAVGPADLTTPATVTVYLRERPDAAAATALPSQSGKQLTREQYAARHGAHPDDVALIADFARQHGLTVGEVELGRRSVQLSGTLASLSDAFGAQLQIYEDPDTGVRYRGRSGSISVPSELGGLVRAVLGLDTRPQARAHVRLAADPTVSYTPPQVAGLYAFPTSVTGAGECVGIIELGGGFRTADLDAYFAQLGLTAPVLTAVDVDGATNSPGTAGGPDGEVMLDIEVVGSIAPGAKIAVYFAPNTSQGFVDAVSTATHDTDNRPSVISISWGSPESTWTTAAMQQLEQTLAAAAAIGVTVTVAAGDNGSTDGVGDGQQHVDFPASAPHALACGGTSVISQANAITSETVWNDPGDGATGGGISAVFPLPSYQSSAHVPPSANPGGASGRGVPDVAGDADPQTGYTVRVDGQTMVVGGTSAVAPLWAGLVALFNQALGHGAGFLNPVLYSSAQAAGDLHDITSGNNGAYSAGPGWDACTGLGSPDGARLLETLTAAPAP